MDIYRQLAEEAIKVYIQEGKIITPNQNSYQILLNKTAGTFVSIKKGQELRGCIGTFLPTKNNIAEEIIHNAIQAATNDPRFYPIGTHELDQIRLSVDVLSKPEQVDSFEALDPQKYGLLVRSQDGRTGLLLPDLEGVDSVDQQFNICCQKAGLDPDQDQVSLYRFTVERHG